MSLRSLRVSLTVASGPMFHPLDHVLSLYLSGLSDETDLRFSGCVAEREQPFRPFDATREEFSELCRAANAAGFAERKPGVEPKVDTSDSASWVLLHVATERGDRTLALHLMSTGFEGPDAPALRRFFGVLLFLAEAKDAGVRRDLAGR